jgi:hypothetical protein
LLWFWPNELSVRHRTRWAERLRSQLYHRRIQIQEQPTIAEGG